MIPDSAIAIDEMSDPKASLVESNTKSASLLAACFSAEPVRLVQRLLIQY
jgi:hypothetical protein